MRRRRPRLLRRLAHRPGRALRRAAPASDGRGSARQPPRRPGGRRRAEADRRASTDPVYVAGAPAPEAALRRRAAGQGRGPARRPASCGQPFLDISRRVAFGGERGLLSIAFPPDYREQRALLRLLHRQRGQHPDRRVPAPQRRPAPRAGSRRAGDRDPPPVNANHNGGQLQFLGDLLYFGTGDGGSGGDPPNNAQNRDVLLGKLLRIDPRPTGGRPYSVPAANPFVGRPGPRRDLQLRAAQPVPLLLRHGQRAASRGSRSATSARTASRSSTTRPSPRPRGANFGWDAFEGFAPYRDENSGTPDPGGTVKPIFAYSHSRGGSCSIIGGYVVARPPPAARSTGATSTPTLRRGSCAASSPTCAGPAATAARPRRLTSPSSFGEDARGHLYVASLDGAGLPRSSPASGYGLADQPGSRREPLVESGTAETSTQSTGTNGAQRRRRSARRADRGPQPGDRRG